MISKLMVGSYSVAKTLKPALFQLRVWFHATAHSAPVTVFWRKPACHLRVSVLPASKMLFVRSSVLSRE